MFCNQDFFFLSFKGSPPLPAEVIVIDSGFHGSLGSGEVMSELILSHTPAPHLCRPLHPLVLFLLQVLAGILSG